jgi:hypothetical protein
MDSSRCNRWSNGRALRLGLRLGAVLMSSATNLAKVAGDAAAARLA